MREIRSNGANRKEQTGKSPRVSIGMPVYNGEPFIVEALDCLLQQDFTDFECIVSDNASTDSTAQICEAYAGRDKRIRFYRNEQNLGAAWNYNRVFSLSTGEYFKWAAHDDVCAPEYLSQCIEVLDHNPAVVLCYPKTAIIDEHSNVIREHEDGLDLRFLRPSSRFRRAIHRIGECNAVFGLIRSDVLRKTALIGNYVAADRALLIELSVHGQFYEIPARLFFRREHPRASSSNRTLQAQQEFFDPKTKGRIFMFSWKHLLSYLAIIRRIPVAPSEQIQMVFSVLRFGIGQRRDVIREPFMALRQKAEGLFK